MCRPRLNAEIARATGESLRTIRQQGFSLLRLAVPIPQPASRLCLACPGCGSDVPLSADAGALPEWADASSATSPIRTTTRRSFCPTPSSAPDSDSSAH